MKKFLAIFILIIMISSLLTGCTSFNITGEDTEFHPNTDSDAGGTTDDEINKLPGSDNKGDTNTDPDDELQTNPDQAPDSEPTYTVGTAVGDMMRSVELQRINGEGTVSVEDYRGKIVIVNFWATWCYYCTVEMPDFDKIASEYIDEVVVIAAHVASNAEEAPEYVEGYSDSNIVFAYDTARNDAYFAAGGTGSIPRTVILDENGIIAYEKTGMMSHYQLLSIIEGLLK